MVQQLLPRNPEHKADLVDPLVPQNPQIYQDSLIHPVPQTPEASKEASLAEGLKETGEGGIPRRANRINRVKGVAQNCPMSQTLQIV